MTIEKSAESSRIFSLIKEGYVSALLLRPELLEHENSAMLKKMLIKALEDNGFALVYSFEAVQSKEAIDKHYTESSESGVLSKLAESGIKIMLSSMKERIPLKDLFDELDARGYISKEAYELLNANIERLEKLACMLAGSPGKPSMKEMAEMIANLEPEERAEIERSLATLGSVLPSVEYRSIGKSIEVWILYSKEGDASERLYGLRGSTDPFFANEKSLRGLLREVSKGRSLARNFLDFGVVSQIVHTEPSASKIIDILELFSQQGFLGEREFEQMLERIINLGKESTNK